MRRLAFALPFVLLAAGCGTTTVTRVVHVKPCASNKAMTECLNEIVNASRAYQGQTSAQVRCRKQVGERFKCVALIDGGCYQALVQRTRSGAAAFLETAAENPARCDELFGKA